MHRRAVSGQVYCWGCNQFGQCGVVPVKDQRHQTSEDQGKARLKDICIVPHQVQLLAPVSTVCCGWSHTLAVTGELSAHSLLYIAISLSAEDRRLYGWGRCDYGQLCTSSEERRDRVWEGKFNPVPTEIVCLRGVQQVIRMDMHFFKIIMSL